VYKLCRTFKNSVDMPILLSLLVRVLLSIESKAALKSTKNAHIFFPLSIYDLAILVRLKMLSTVEYPFIKPAWNSVRILWYLPSFLAARVATQRRL